MMLFLNNRLHFDQPSYIIIDSIMEVCCPYFDPEFENLNEKIYGPRSVTWSHSLNNHQKIFSYAGY